MRLRPIHEEDLPLLNALAGERPLSLAQVRFFARTHHSFLAEGEAPLGFALAQALWQGEQATVLINRIEGKSQEVLAGLIRAVTKSAYDAGVYEVALHVDPGRELLKEALLKEGFQVGPLVLAVRVLGTRGEARPYRGVLE